MPPSNGGAPIGAIRNAASAAVRATSLRSVASAVDMSPTGLRHFLNGRTPYPATLRKLKAWYVRYQLSRREFSADVAQAGVAVLLEAIPEDQLAGATRQLLDALREIHRERGVAPPLWLEALGVE